MDGSQVYGSDEALAKRLRDKKKKLGLLDVRPYINSNGEPILPEADEEAFCRSSDPEASPCFLAGDIRVNENHGSWFIDWLIHSLIHSFIMPTKISIMQLQLGSSENTLSTNIFIY